MSKLLIILSLIALSACAEDEGPQRGLGSAIVTGRVMNREGLSVSGAAVKVLAVHSGIGTGHVGECVGTPIPNEFMDATDANGVYRIRVETGLTFVTTICLHLEVLDEGAGLPLSSRSGISLQTGDSIEVNFELDHQ